MKFKELKDKISGTAIAAVIAIVALLIITVDQKNDKDVLRAELANAEVGISGVEAGYLDSIAHFEGTIQTYELEIAAITDIRLASWNPHLEVPLIAATNTTIPGEALPSGHLITVLEGMQHPQRHQLPA